MTNAICTIWWLLTEPSRGFAHAQRQPVAAGLITLFLLILATSLLFVFYYHSVNLTWLQDRLVAGADPVQADDLRKHLTRAMLVTSSIIGILVTVPIIDSAYAVYFFLIGLTRNVPESFGKWFVFVVWSSVPGLLFIPLAAVTIIMHADGQIAPEQLNATSLNELIFHFSHDNVWKSLCDNLSLIFLWNAVLMVIGFRCWTRFSLKSSIAIVLVPNILFYGSWTAIIAASHAS
jgi:Yip1 domain